MLEDSISCSPGNEKKRSRSRRFHKSAKIKSQRLAGASLTENSCTTDRSFFTDFYEDTETTENAQWEDFNPFENEALLAAAERARASTSRSLPKSCISQGFVVLGKIPPTDEPLMPPPKPSTVILPLSPIAQPIFGPQTQFGITESEFVRFCDEAEVEIHSEPNNVDSKTSIASNSIVDAILNDFCGSPYSESPPKFLPEDANPIFRFKSESVRTYSGQTRTISRRNIADEMTKANISDDDDCASDSSDLSVMEDLSERAVPQLDTVDLNNSLNICENLLRLSSYFSQTSLHDKSFAASANSQRLALSAVVEDILDMKKKKKSTVNRERSAEEFYGFSDSEEEPRPETLKNFFEDEDEVLRKINCDSLCYDKVTPRVTFGQNYNDFEAADMMGEQTRNEETNFLMSPVKGDKDMSSVRGIGDIDAERIDNTTNCNLNSDQCDNTKTCSSRVVPLNEEQLFDDNDIWSDSECLLNYKTQKPQTDNVKIVDCNNSHPRSPANQRTYRQDIGNEIQTKLFVSPSKRIHSVNNEYTDAPSTSRKLCAGISSSSSHFQGFSTAAMKPIVISDVAKRKAEQTLAKFEKDELELKAQGATDVVSEPDLVGLSTTSKASPKTILKNFELEESTANITAPPQKVIAGVDCPSTSAFVGFSTASRKSIVISDKAKRKADDIIRKFEQEERERQLKEKEFQVQEDDKIRTRPGVPKFNEWSQKPSNDFGRLSAAASTNREKTSGIAKQDVIKKLDERDGHINISFPKPNLATKSSIDFASNSGFVGFSTASRKSITISDEAKRRADEIIKKFEKAEQALRLDDPDTPSTSAQTRQLDPVPDEIEKKEQDLLMDITFFDDAFEEEMKTIEEQTETSVNLANSTQFENTDVASFEGFKTASKKSIHISENAKQHAEKLLNGVESENLPQDYLKCIEADLDEAESKTEVNPTWNSEQVNRVPKLDTENALEDEIEASVDQTDVGFARVDEFNAEEYHNSMHNKSLKRKRRASCSDGLQVSPIPMSPKVGFNDRTPLNRIENTSIRKTSSVPLIKSTPRSALISRKNLLSLSKKRKKVDSPGGGESPAPKTPEKGKPLSINSNATPNLKEFFDSVSTSTPRLIRQIEDGGAVSKDKSIDADFRQIPWDDANNSARLCRTTSSLHDPNVSCADMSPTPKQRIERLKMYGEPPPVSPILMVNCRQPGLRRGRRLMKP